jgi:hypothetical protein
MTDADKLRDILELTDCSRGQWEPLLDSLVAAFDEERIMREHADVEARTAREQRHAAEVERDEAHEQVAHYRDFALQAGAERDKANVEWHRIRDLHGEAIKDLREREARVTELEAALGHIAFLHIEDDRRSPAWADIARAALGEDA